MPKKILVLGASGLLGGILCPYLERKEFQVFKHGNKSVEEYRANFTKLEEASNLLSLIKPNIIINLIGLTDVDYCERNPQDAFLVNSHIVKNVAHWMKKTSPSCHLVQISTDQVYDRDMLHVEENISPINYYAFSKFIGELEAANVPSTVLRVNFFGKSKTPQRKSFTDWLFEALIHQENIDVVNDVYFSPLSMDFLVEMIYLVAEKRIIGTFNLGASSGMSKAEFAFAFAEELGFSKDFMKMISIEKLKALHARRPKNMVMNIEKFERTFGVKLPNMIDEISRVAKTYDEFKG